MKWKSLEPRPRESEPISSESTLTPLPGVLDESELFLPGSGMAKKLYSLRCADTLVLHNIMCIPYYCLLILLHVL